MRAAAVAVARELERRRPELITSAWWKEERGRRVFVDYNQNAPHKTVFGAWSVRARPGAQVSTPFRWEELDRVDVAGREITVTSSSKVFFTERGETKLDLVRYYLAVAEPLLRTVGRRPSPPRASSSAAVRS